MQLRKTRIAVMTTRLLVISILASFDTSNAALIEVDDPVFGPASLTRDTSSGLEWLDLTQTVNLTLNEVSAELVVGGVFENFRYASLDELEALWVSVGISDYNAAQNFISGNVLGVSSLVLLMGETNSLNGTLPGEGIGHIGLTPFNDVEAHRSFVEFSLGQTAARAALAQFTTPNDFILPDRIGHYLVRRIPEPSANVLLAIGLAGCTAILRKP